MPLQPPCAIQPYNEQLETLSSGIYAAFGIGHLRQLKTSPT